MEKGERIFFAGRFYEVAYVAKFPHGKMIAIEDEPNHIDYISPDSVNAVYPCTSCQGGGCPTCFGYGEIVADAKGIKL